MKKFEYWSVVIIFILVIVGWLAFPSILASNLIGEHIKPEDTLWQGRGTVGDSFGALNTLFSGLAFVGIIATIFLQSRELSETRAELRGQKEQLESQVFENKFFQLLNLLSNMPNSFNYTELNDNKAYGRECMAKVSYDFSTLLNQGGLPTPENLSNMFESFYTEYGQSVLGQYYRTLHQIIKYVHFSIVRDKTFYTEIIKVQLSGDDLHMLFYYGKSKYGKESLAPLLEEYAFFEHMEHSDVIFSYAHLYDQKAYGGKSLNSWTAI